MFFDVSWLGFSEKNEYIGGRQLVLTTLLELVAFNNFQQNHVQRRSFIEKGRKGRFIDGRECYLEAFLGSVHCAAENDHHQRYAAVEF